jgi:M6 family metalloprotease-like protein
MQKRSIWPAAALAAATLGLAGEASALQAWRGQQRAVVVLVEWQNEPAHVTREQLDATFFSQEPGAMSLRQFFQENSQGAFDLTGDVVDWRTVRTRWSPTSGCSLAPIVNAAWQAFPELRTSDYDSDGNGKIDNFFVVHSGRIGSDRVGPECTFTDDRRADNTVVFQSEGLGSIGTGIPIGFYIHEGGHGYYDLPDLYADHYNGRYGVGMWGMMGLGAWGTRNDLTRDQLFRYPSHFEPLSKVTIGWIQPRVVTTTTRGVVIRPVETSGDIVSVPAGLGKNFYLEYRSPHGFSANMHGHGLLLWKNFDLIQADGRDDLNHGNPQGERPLPPITENFGDDTDPFPGADGVTSYEDRRAGVRFENIVQTDDAITLDIVVTHRAPLRYTEPVFEGYTGDERL